MTLRDINLANSYNSDEVDVAKTFFEPVLKESILYKRVAAYFSSTSFIALSEGLSSFIWNEGKMLLIVARLVSEDDYEAVLQGKTTPEDVMSSIFLKDRDDLKVLTKVENVKALAYLLASNKLEMKFVITSKLQSIFHLKFGIFIDALGNKVSFSGSINETLSAYSENIEEFKVFRNWIVEENKYLNIDELKFDSIFAGDIKRDNYTVVDLPDRVRNILLELNDSSEFSVIKRTEKQIVLRDYQRLAKEKWIESSFSGIIQMATGTGKTLVAVECIKYVIKEITDKPLLVIIGSPTLALIRQWHIVLSKYFDRDKILNTNIGKELLYSRLSTHGESRGYHLILLGTYATLSNNWFTREVLEPDKYLIFFIADEAHWLGAPKLNKAMKKEYKFKLGLTATPIRQFDESGTSDIIHYFGSIIFKFGIKEAIKKGFLTQYYYYLHIASLNKDEMSQYIKLTKEIPRVAYFKVDGDSNSENKLSLVLNKRARIIKKANDKFRVLNDILSSLSQENKLKKLIIYFEDTEQIKDFMNSIYPIYDNKIFRVIDSKTPEETRNSIIKSFSNGNVDCLVSMKILDEGLDIPSAERAIFISSSSNPRQFIQRRGRILRVSSEKRQAEIHDIFVGIDTGELPNEMIRRIEKKITTSELKRICAFGANCSNKSMFLSDLDLIGKKTNINVWQILRDVENEI